LTEELSPKLSALFSRRLSRLFSRRCCKAMFSVAPLEPLCPATACAASAGMAVLHCGTKRMRAARALRTAVAAHAAALKISRLPNTKPSKKNTALRRQPQPLARPALRRLSKAPARQAGQQPCLVLSSSARQMPLLALAVLLSSLLVETEDRPAPAAVAQASLQGAALHVAGQTSPHRRRPPRTPVPHNSWHSLPQFTRHCHLRA